MPDVIMKQPTKALIVSDKPERYQGKIKGALVCDSSEMAAELIAKEQIHAVFCSSILSAENGSSYRVLRLVRRHNKKVPFYVMREELDASSETLLVGLGGTGIIGCKVSDVLAKMIEIGLTISGGNENVQHTKSQKIILRKESACIGAVIDTSNHSTPEIRTEFKRAHPPRSRVRSDDVSAIKNVLKKYISNDSSADILVDDVLKRLNAEGCLVSKGAIVRMLTKHVDPRSVAGFVVDCDKASKVGA